MKITVKAEKKPNFIYEPSYLVSVEGNFSQTQILKVRSAVDKFTKAVDPILAETSNDDTKLTKPVAPQPLSPEQKERT